MDHSDEISGLWTDLARQYLARAVNGELVYQISGFSVGSGGFDPSNISKILPVNTSLPALINQVYPDATAIADLQSIDRPTDTTMVFSCRLPSTLVASNADYPLGEIGIWANIISSSNPAEVGQKFLWVVAHFPVRAKTRRDVFLFRVVVQL